MILVWFVFTPIPSFPNSPLASLSGAAERCFSARLRRGLPIASPLLHARALPPFIEDESRPQRTVSDEPIPFESPPLPFRPLHAMPPAAARSSFAHRHPISTAQNAINAAAMVAMGLPCIWFGYMFVHHWSVHRSATTRDHRTAAPQRCGHISRFDRSPGTLAPGTGFSSVHLSLPANPPC